MSDGAGLLWFATGVLAAEGVVGPWPAGVLAAVGYACWRWWRSLNRSAVWT